jgi:exonuclease III
LLANYYGLNSDEIYLLEDFGNRLEQLNDMPIVCGGDWNLIMENIDKKGGSSVLTHKQNREHLRQLMDRNDLIDIWRIHNPMEKKYSWRQIPNIQCRLDSCLISVGLGNITRITDISYPMNI